MTTQAILFEKENKFNQFNQKYDYIVDQFCAFASDCAHSDRKHCFQCLLYLIGLNDKE